LKNFQRPLDANAIFEITERKGTASFINKRAFSAGTMKVCQVQVTVAEIQIHFMKHRSGIGGCSSKSSNAFNSRRIQQRCPSSGGIGPFLARRNRRLVVEAFAAHFVDLPSISLLVTAGDKPAAVLVGKGFYLATVDLILAKK
jgi:hypothetical protein